MQTVLMAFGPSSRLSDSFSQVEGLLYGLLGHFVLYLQLILQPHVDAHSLQIIPISSHVRLSACVTFSYSRMRLLPFHAVD
jgi:hypothetical protein